MLGGVTVVGYLLGSLSSGRSSAAVSPMTPVSLLQGQQRLRLASRLLVPSRRRGWEAAYGIGLRTKLPSSKVQSLGR